MPVFDTSSFLRFVYGVREHVPIVSDVLSFSLPELEAVLMYCLLVGDVRQGAIAQRYLKFILWINSSVCVHALSVR